jgi:hypothetical protein
MSGRATILLAYAVIALALGPAAAAASANTELTHTPPDKAKSAKAKRAASQMERKTKPAAEAQAPCARGTWKDDPVCFGEGDRNTLPTPSASSAESNGGAKNDASVKPMVNINSRTSAPGAVYQSNGNSLTSDFGGGVSLHLPF